MKKTYTTVLLVCIWGIVSAQTTLEEYNYVTKGYKIQIESGLDMKKGYLFKDVIVPPPPGTHGVGYTPRTTTFKALYRDGEKSPCAILMIYERAETNFIQYFCIPHYLSDAKIWMMFLESTKVLDSMPARETVIHGMARCMAYFSQNN